VPPSHASRTAQSAHADMASSMPPDVCPPEPLPQEALADFSPLPACLFRTAERLNEQPAYFVRSDTGWVPCSWRDHAQQIRDAAKSLIAMGVSVGDAVAIHSFNRPEWSVMAMAAMTVGATPVGIYWTSPSQDIAYILNHCKASVLLVENEALIAQVMPALSQAPHLKHLVLLQGKADLPAPIQVCAWSEFLTRAHAQSDAVVTRRLSAIRAEDIGTLIYTSGTTGPAKAVMLSHGNLWWTATAMSKVFNAAAHDRVISYLPLAHIAEQMNSLHNHALIGFAVYFATSLESLGEHLKEVQPTIFFGVPRVWEKMQAAIEAKLQQATGGKAKLARWAMDVGQRWHACTLSGEPVSPWLALQMRVAGVLIHRKVKTALGFSQSRLLSSGAAPIAPDTLRFFAGLDVMVRELYGQSEACGPVTLSLPGSTRVGSVGKALPGTQMAVATDGELLVRGPHVFQGYMGQPQATQEALAHGWLHTGDLGRIDADGYVHITGRKKDLIITSGGKNISPGNIEAALMDGWLIEHAVVCGDGHNYLVVLLTLDNEALSVFAQTHCLSHAQRLDQHPEVLKQLQASVDHVNAGQPRVAHIRKFAVLDAPLSVETGELTPTLKIKRKTVLERHRALIAQLYAEAP
jgi:long-chain acyl-CoA synthetase